MKDKTQTDMFPVWQVKCSPLTYLYGCFHPSSCSWTWSHCTEWVAVHTHYTQFLFLTVASFCVCVCSSRICQWRVSVWVPFQWAEWGDGHGADHDVGHTDSQRYTWRNDDNNKNDLRGGSTDHQCPVILLYSSHQVPELIVYTAFYLLLNYRL